MKKFIVTLLSILFASSAFAWNTGDLIKLYKNNGGTCDAIMITPGNSRSEVQFDGGCSNFLWHKSDGDRMWVDNSVIGSR